MHYNINLEKRLSGRVALTTTRFTSSSQYNVFTFLQVGEKVIVRDIWLNATEKCVFNLGTYAHNPVKDWLRARIKEEYPAFKLGSNSVSVDWGLAETFNCNLNSFKIKSIQLELKHEVMRLSETQIQMNKLIPTQFKNLQSRNVTDLRCFSWKIDISLTTEMLKFLGKIIYEYNNNISQSMYRNSPSKRVLPTI